MGLMGDAENLSGRLLVIFDGGCGFCNRTVLWLLRRDRRDRLRFVAFENEKAAGVLGRHGIAAPEPDGGSLVVVRGFGGPRESVQTQSDGVVALLRELPGRWPAVGAALRLIPRVVRDRGYGVVARWRHRIGGRLESCPAPTTEEREKFL
jgi:predicted DCC family thiol-disulfide oxidoreductase YuxK